MSVFDPEQTLGLPKWTELTSPTGPYSQAFFAGSSKYTGSLEARLSACIADAAAAAAVTGRSTYAIVPAVWPALNISLVAGNAAVRVLREAGGLAAYSDVNAFARIATEIIAHRGAGTNGSGAAAPENTIAAVGYAAEWAQGMETDVQMTSDGVPICIHDLTVDRTTSGSGAVTSFTLAGIQALDAGTKFDPRFANARVPKFSDWLIAASQASRLLYPEIKAYRTTADIAVMMAVITSLGLEDRCVVQSFNGLTDFPFVRAVSSRIVVGHIVSDANLWAAALSAAFADGNAVMIAEQAMLLANPTFITNARAGGVDIIAWTVDSTDTVRQLTDLGVRRIMSNRILRLFTAA